MSDASSGERRPLVNDLVAMKLKEFAARHCPNITGDALSSAIDEILGVEEVATELLAAPSSAEPHATDASEKQNVANQSTAPKVDLRLSLSFKHDCMAMGCQDVECTLCQFNPIRACSRNFRKKYLVGDSLMATCGAPLKIQLKTADGELCEDVSLPGFQLEASLIDGVAFKEKGGDFNILSKEEIQSCVKFTNHGDEPLLQSTSGAPVSSSKVVMSITNGFAVLPDVHVSESSEALLTGRKPPFRLLVQATQDGSSDCDPHSICGGVHYATSEEFVVATRRVKQANKAEIPLMDDHISKIEHIGRETVKKLMVLRNAAADSGYPLDLPNSLTSITTVGQFVELVGIAEKDGQMKKVLQVILKLSKEKWEEAAAHALTAVMPDFRKRVWFPPGDSTHGILFTCKYGAVLLKDQVSLLQSDGHGGSHKITAEADLDPVSLVSLKELKSRAVASWWELKHPGWCIFKSGDTDGSDKSFGGVAPSIAMDSSRAPALVFPHLRALQPFETISTQQPSQSGVPSLFVGDISDTRSLSTSTTGSLAGSWQRGSQGSMLTGKSKGSQKNDPQGSGSSSPLRRQLKNIGMHQKSPASDLQRPSSGHLAELQAQLGQIFGQSLASPNTGSQLLARPATLPTPLNGRDGSGIGPAKKESHEASGSGVKNVPADIEVAGFKQRLAKRLRTAQAREDAAGDGSVKRSVPSNLIKSSAAHDSSHSPKEGDSSSHPPSAFMPYATSASVVGSRQTSLETDLLAGMGLPSSSSELSTFISGLESLKSALSASGCGKSPFAASAIPAALQLEFMNGGKVGPPGEGGKGLPSLALGSFGDWVKNSLQVAQSQGVQREEHKVKEEPREEPPQAKEEEQD